MPPAVAAAAIGAAGAIGGGLLASSGASKAARIQSQADQTAINEQQREFNTNQANFAPFLSAGRSALGQFGNLVGINGANPQSAAITALQGSPYYQSLYRNGEQAVLANASATGGIRGGNTQRSLANFGADTLAQTIQQQLENLGGLAGMGLGATGANATTGQNSTNAISSLLGEQGAAQGGAAATNGGIWSSVIQSLGNSLRGALPSTGSSIFGGGGYTPTAYPGNATFGMPGITF